MTTATEDAAAGPEVIVAEQGRAGLVKLNRPKALNAMTLGMIQALERFYHRCAKAPHIYGIVLEGEGRAFCAGGDIRSIYDHGREGPHDGLLRLYAEEYQHNWTLECFTKPSVALINGIVMGGGVGVCLYGTHRVAGEGTRFAMPETGIGFFPDAGGGWFLPRMPGKTGLYLGLTGTIINQADTFHVGAATHCIAFEHFETIKAAMIEADPIDPVLDSLHTPPEESEIETLRPAIDRVFAAPSVEEIIARLADETGEFEAWALKTRDTLFKRSPLALKVTFEHLRRGEAYTSLKDALVVEHRLTRRFLQQPDLYEEIRAAIVDKSRPAEWRPATLAEVSDEMVRSLFASPEEGDITLTDYWKLID